MIINALNGQQKLPARITKTDKDFSKRLDFKDIKLPVRTTDIHKIEQKKNSSIDLSVKHLLLV